MNKRESFLADVMHEINALREHGTQEEKQNLNFETFRPSEPDRCIYGQMTGDCVSYRAKELMDVSCIRVMKLTNGSSDIRYRDIEDEEFNINGEYTGQTWGLKITCSSLYWRFWQYLSALEAYICTKDAKNAEVLAYIKGEIDTLEL